VTLSVRKGQIPRQAFSQPSVTSLEKGIDQRILDRGTNPRGGTNEWGQVDTTMPRGHTIVIVFVVLILCAALVLFREGILLAVGDFLVIRDKLRPADVIHVIAGSDERTDYAIQLYQQGYAKEIFFTGGWCRFHNYFHGLHGRERALQRGIPSQTIAIDESPVTSTYGEVVRLKDFIDRSKAPIRSVIVVSDPHHMRRARWTYQNILAGKIAIEMAPVPFELSPDKRRWWTDRESRMYVEAEYTKILYYYARYRFSWGFLKDWLASLERD
jgi:uncharacterized SAM-binding protein YcdF (DUF218 family)